MGLYFLLCIFLWEHCAVAFPCRRGTIGPGLLRIFEACSANYLRYLFINNLTSFLFVASFACLTMHCLFFSSQVRIISRALQVGMAKSKNMVKDRRKVSRRIRPDLKPQDPLRSKGAARKPDPQPNKLRHIQGIVQGKARGHTAMFDTGNHQSMIGRDSWEIIKRHDKWIGAKGVDLWSSLKAGRHLQLVDARGVVKNRLDGKR